MAQAQQISDPTNPANIDYQVIEDAAGGLHLALFDINGDCTHFMSGFESQPQGSLRHTIQYLRQGAHPDTCEGLSPNPQGEYDDLTEYECGWQVVADTDGEYHERMGASAEREIFFL